MVAVTAGGQLPDRGRGCIGDRAIVAQHPKRVELAFQLGVL